MIISLLLVLFAVYGSALTTTEVEEGFNEKGITSLNELEWTKLDVFEGDSLEKWEFEGIESLGNVKYGFDNGHLFGIYDTDVTRFGAVGQIWPGKENLEKISRTPSYLRVSYTVEGTPNTISHLLYAGDQIEGYVWGKDGTPYNLKLDSAYNVNELAKEASFRLESLSGELIASATARGNGNLVFRVNGEEILSTIILVSSVQSGMVNYEDRFSVSIKTTDMKTLPSFRLRVNRGGDRVWENYDVITVVPRLMTQSWDVGKPKTFNLILRTDQYPINSENALLVFFDVLGVRETTVSGSLKLTKVEISQSRLTKSQLVKDYTFNDSTYGQDSTNPAWQTEEMVPPLPPISINRTTADGFRFTIISPLSGTPTESTVQFGFISSPLITLNQSNVIYQFLARFNKIMPLDNFEPQGCVEGPLVRLRVNSEDWAYGHEKGYILHAGGREYPLDYPDESGSTPLQLFFSFKDAQQSSQSTRFRSSIDLINSSPTVCVGSGLNVESAAINRYFNKSVIGPELETEAD